MNQALRVYGSSTLTAKLKEWERRHTFFVADIATGIVLGADFLRQHNIDALFSQECLRWDEGAVNLDPLSNHSSLQRTLPLN